MKRKGESFTMRRDFDLSSRKAVAITIGAMKNEECFYALLGTVVATAILGKIPSREDRASFMGTSETKLAKLVKEQIEFAYYEKVISNHGLMATQLAALA
ncbi:hypothetical protein IJG79_01665 [Candidatus Saccharibacteria bacterium]|nr:hypothetical protein [Candidatus Saccharibacteria bacterium]